MRTDSTTSTPSDSRWRARSVRPSSASRTSVSMIVSNRNAASMRLAQRRGERACVVERRGPAAPDGVAELAGAVAGLARLHDPGAQARRGPCPTARAVGSRSPGASRADDDAARRSRVGGRHVLLSRAMSSTRLSALRGPRRARASAPRLGAASSRGRRAAARRRGRAGRRRWRARVRRRARRACPGVRRRRSGGDRSSATDGLPHDESAGARSRRSCPATGGARAPGAPGTAAGHRRVERTVGAAERAGHGDAVRRLRPLGRPPASHGPSDAASRSAASAAAPLLEARRVLRPVERPPDDRDDRPACPCPASMRNSVTPVSVSPAAIAAGIGVAPRWRGSSDGCRLRKPCRGSVQDARPAGSGRSRRAPRASGRSGSDRRGRLRRCAARPAGAAAARPPARGRRRRWASASPRRPAGRSGARTTPTSRTQRRREPALEDREGEAAGTEEDDPGRRSAGRAPSGPGRRRSGPVIGQPRRATASRVSSSTPSSWSAPAG